MPSTSSPMPTHRTRTKRLAGLLALLPLLFLLHVPAASAEDFLSIPITDVVFGQEGDVVLVAGADVPAAYIGQTCQVLGQTENQESVHESNDLLIVTAGRTLTIANFENQGFITYDSGEVVELGSRIDVSVRLGPDGISSGGFRVMVNCGDDEVSPSVPCVPTADAPCPTTTTTTPACVPTPDAPCPTTTTTTPACVPTPDAPCETTTTAAPAGPTIPADSTTTTAAPAGPVVPGDSTPSTTTTAPAPAGPVVPGDSTPTSAPEPLGPTAAGAQLPVTGSSAAGILGVGVALLAAGYLVNVNVRSRHLPQR